MKSSQIVTNAVSRQIHMLIVQIKPAIYYSFNVKNAKQKWTNVVL